MKYLRGNTPETYDMVINPTDLAALQVALTYQKQLPAANASELDRRAAAFVELELAQLAFDMGDVEYHCSTLVGAQGLASATYTAIRARNNGNRQPSEFDATLAEIHYVGEDFFGMLD